MSTIYVSIAHSLVGRLVILLSLFTLCGPVLSKAENLKIDSTTHVNEPLTVALAAPTISGFTSTSSTVCAGIAASFTATLANISGSYNYTLTNCSSTSMSGSATTPSFSQTLVVSGTGSQSFSLVVSASDGSSVASTNLTVGTHPDYQPLVDLYNSTTGASWTNKTGWLTNCNACGGWYGVGCSGESEYDPSPR